MTSDKVLTTGGDGFIKIFDILQQTITKSFKVCDLNIPTATCLKENEIYAVRKSRIQYLNFYVVGWMG